MKSKQKKISRLMNPINLALLVIVISFFGVLSYKIIWPKFKSNNQQTQHSQPPDNNAITQQAPKTKLKTFSSDQFRDLYNHFAYPNTEYINQDTVITGDIEADKHIQKLAESKGYVRRSAPVTDAFIKVQEPDYVLQQRAATDYEKLKQAGIKDKIDLSLMAAYRSSQDQRQIFLERVGNLNPRYVVAGGDDARILQVLKTTAIPGYSRHHTGYTIDLACDNQPGTVFEYTVCFDWLSAENYKNAKTYGWIPSYPEGASQQGPEPEPWEYVWVGTDATFE